MLLHTWLSSATAKPLNRVDASATCSVFEGGGLGQADHAVLGRVIGRTPGNADDAGDRRAIDDGTAAEPEHLAQLVLHAAPNAAQVDCHHAIPLVAADVSRFDAALHDASIVERGVEAPEAGHGSFDHGRHFFVIGD